MADPLPTDPDHRREPRARPPLLRSALVLGGLAALGWWWEGRRDAVLVARTRARLRGGSGTPAGQADRRHLANSSAPEVG